MRTETINILTFDELDEQGKECALDWYRDGQEIHWGDEWIESLKRFCDEFGIELCHWEYGTHGVTINTNIEYLDYGQDATINKYEGEDCPFTGYCGDETLLYHLRKLEQPADRIETLQLCLDEWVKDFNEDIDYQCGDEYAIDHINANEYEFTEDGLVYHG